MGLGVGRRLLLLVAVAWLTTMGGPARVAAGGPALKGGKLHG